MVTREEFHAAYDAWKAATDGHKRTMAAVPLGKEPDAERLTKQLAEIERLHADWMTKAAPFVLRKQ